jgi:hypothetical protein
MGALFGTKSQEPPASPSRTPERRSEPPDKGEDAYGQTAVREKRRSWNSRWTEGLGRRKEAFGIVGAWAIFGAYHLFTVLNRPPEEQ